MTTPSPWRRRPGLVTSRTPHAARAVGFLDGAQVLALVEHDPEAPYALALAIAVDAEDRVAVLDEDGEAIVAGPPVGELVEALAHECHALVSFEGVSAEGPVDPDATDDERDEDPFDPEIDVESARSPERAVLLTSAGPEALQALATAAHSHLWVHPYGAAHLVLVDDPPALTELHWGAEYLPVIVVEQSAVFPSVAVLAEPGAAHLFTWDSHLEALPSAAAAPAVVAEFVEENLGSGALVRELAAVAPHADPARIRAALDGPSDEGATTLATALDFPADVVAFLAGELPAADVTDVAEVVPVTIVETVRRAVTGAAEEARAGARAGVRAGTTAVVDTAQDYSRSWVPAALAGVELLLGVAAVRRAGRGIRAGQGSTAGERALGLTGAVLLVGAVVNGAVATVPRVRAFLSRR